VVLPCKGIALTMRDVKTEDYLTREIEIEVLP